MENKKQSLNYKIAVTGIMGALTVLLAFTPIGYIQVGFVAITLVHIPTVLATVAAGLVPGVACGAIFGVSSLIVAATSQAGLNPLFLNPAVSILPRVLFPIIVWGIYKLFDLIPHMPKTISASIGAALGTLAHTFLVMGSLFIIYAKRVMELLNMDITQINPCKAFWIVTSATIASNGIWEIIAATVLTAAVMGSIYAVNSKKSKISKMDK